MYLQQKEGQTFFILFFINKHATSWFKFLFKCNIFLIFSWNSSTKPSKENMLFVINWLETEFIFLFKNSFLLFFWIFSCKHQVEKSSSSILHRSADPSTYPAPPGTPKAVNVTQNSIALRWSRSQEKPQATSPIIG